MIDLASLIKAIKQLETSIGYYHSDLAQADEALLEQFRSASIQAFEYTYELAHKMLRRYLEATEPSVETVVNMSFPEIIRTGWERGLLASSWDVWSSYRKARGCTSHTYDSDKAEEVFQIIPKFLQEVHSLVDEILKRQNDGRD